jgi:hypothetical protein
MNMDWSLVVPTATTLILAGLGWYIVHHLNMRREITAEKRKLRVSYLLEVYRKLEGAANRLSSTTEQHMRDIESAIADIQLLGTPNQVELAVEFATAFGNIKSASLDPLLADLRDSLRAELELEKIPVKLKFLRYISGKMPD